jgi:hypothetical protein
MNRLTTEPPQDPEAGDRRETACMSAEGDSDADLWEKGRAASIEAAGWATGQRGPWLPAFLSRLDRCIVCGKLMTEDIWSRPVVELSKRVRPPANETLSTVVIVHEECVDAGAARAREQKYGWRRKESPWV